jgi:hypothetical protein
MTIIKAQLISNNLKPKKMETKNQTSKANKLSSEGKGLRYDYSELDKYLKKKISPTGLSINFRNMHLALTEALSAVINKELKPGAHIDTSGVYNLINFFRILEDLPFNERPIQ